jgi:putative transposase
MDEVYKTYPHNPPHLFLPSAVYIVTGAILHNHPILRSDEHKSIFCDTLFERAEVLEWSLEAWAVLGNHYHFVARSPENAHTLVRLIREIHSITAIAFNRVDNTSGRKVWYNYWDSCITYEASYLSRLHYVHINPVKHGIAERAEDYPFCSYRWFLENALEEFQRSVLSQPIDRVKVFDLF